ncbi:Myeloid leukemia factor 1 [Lamellibrachia satsuma]|nr:Myeloid leukemia factor 1 [Lamellibrachia satsuma]
MYKAFEEDPFFSSHTDHLQQIDGMFGHMLPSGNQPMAITGPDNKKKKRGEAGPLDIFGGMFGGSMFGGFDDMMHQMQSSMSSGKDNPNSHFYSQSNVMTYKKDHDKEPEVFQASTAVRQAPGGVRETKKLLRDTTKHMEKRAIGRNIGRRGHAMIQTKNTATGQVEEDQDIEDMEEADLPTFHNEWQQKTTERFGCHGGGGHRPASIASGRNSGVDRSYKPSAITYHKPKHHKK